MSSSNLPSTAPSHGHPAKDPQQPLTNSSTNPPSTSSHPPRSKPDPSTSNASQTPQGSLTATPPTRPPELARLEVTLRSALRQYPDFPSPGILFEDIMPLFVSPALHEDLIHALHLLVTHYVTSQKIDVVVGLESRGFLFGPSLALRLGAAFVPVRKKGKLPGPCETEGFQKEYGADEFQMQSDAIKPGQRVVIVDDIIATGELCKTYAVDVLLIRVYCRWKCGCSWQARAKTRR